MTWHRVNSRHKCPVCNKPRWCVYSDEGMIVCMRVQSDKPCRSGGWLHTKAGFQPTPQKQREAPPLDVVAYWTWLKSRQDASCAYELQKLGEQLGGMPVAFIQSEGVLWEPERKAAAFAMLSEMANPIGVRLRGHDGWKGSIHGSRSGILYPKHIGAAETVYIVEGQTDYLVMRYFGLYAIGRQSCMGGEAMVKAVVDALDPNQVIIVPDIDVSMVAGEVIMPGRTGAIRLAEHLQRGVVLRRPAKKDMRAWVLADGLDNVKREVMAWL